MTVIAHEPSCLQGVLVHVEVDIRRGIPGVDLVGLAAGAVREARERVRAAVRNSGFQFPQDRVLINLAPADMPKVGAAYDLPIAIAVLASAGQIPDPGFPILVLGELRLDGSVKPIRGVLPAVAAALKAGVSRFVVPQENAAEARAPGRGEVYPLAALDGLLALLSAIRDGSPPAAPTAESGRAAAAHASGLCLSFRRSAEFPDLADLRGQARLRRALEIAAAGRHNILLVGAPGAGKTMAARRLPGILPDLDEEDAMSVASIYSLAGLIDADSPISRRPPFRTPHHSASLEGMIGSSRARQPGEISLAHKGLLFLDEASEFRADVLTALREPIEEGRVSLVRAGALLRLPADFQLALAANPCPCGNLGRPGRVCLCSSQELARHRKKMGGPLLDRIDIRVPVEPVSARELTGLRGESSALVRARVEKAVAIQRERYKNEGIIWNAHLGPGHIEKYCGLDGGARVAFETAVSRLSLSSRACHSILRTARTIADLAGSRNIGEIELLEAVQHRRYGEAEEVWPGGSQL